MSLKLNLNKTHYEGRKSYHHNGGVDGRDEIGKVVSVADDIRVNQNEENEPFQRNVHYSTT